MYLRRIGIVLCDICHKDARFTGFIKLSRLSSTNALQTGAELSKCYAALGLHHSCTKKELKNKYLFLVKTYHPDTGGKLADSEKFDRVRNSYRFILDHDFSDSDRSELEDLPKIFDIRHTAPQHRQYLEYEGLGSGTPTERQKQHQQRKVARASEHVHDYLVEKMLAQENPSAIMRKQKEEAYFTRKSKTTNAIDRLVDDLIKESMLNGEFDNLPGSGKPIRSEFLNPYIDETEQRINKIMSQQGFCPGWVLLDKEIRQEIKTIRHKFFNFRKKFPKDSNDFTKLEAIQWEKKLKELNDESKELNRRIDHFNLVVPVMWRQMPQLSPKRELEKAEKSVQESLEQADSVPGETSSVNVDKNPVDEEPNVKEAIGNVFKSLLSSMKQ